MPLTNPYAVVSLDSTTLIKGAYQVIPSISVSSKEFEVQKVQKVTS
jgi:hypothetical protein